MQIESQKMREGMSERLNLDVMSAEEMGQLRGGKGMRQSEPSDAQSLESEPRAQRKYPRVFPKFRNPKEPSETWSGRGKQPRWLAAA
jgi:DNA-binding protein H-NS